MAGGGVDREALSAALDGLDAAFERVAEFDCQALTTPEQLALLQRFERLRRRLPAVEHPLINSIARQATPEELGGKLSHAIAEWTLISRAEAARRINEAADLGPRHGLTGERLAPVLAATAVGQRDGTLGTGQVAVIRRFYHQLPGWIDATTREQVEAELATQASHYRPEQLAALADTLADALNPDGTYTDEDRARRRGLMLGNQGPDGMSPLRGWLTPEARITLEAVWAKLAAPGMCNPNDDTPTVDGPPSQQAIDKDARGPAQRQHDALLSASWAYTNFEASRCSACDAYAMPHERPNKAFELYAGVLRRMGHYRWFSLLGKHVLTSVDRALIRASRGRLSLSGPEMATMLLTTTGRRSGKERTVPVYYVRDGKNLVAVCENYGLDKASSWPHNLLAEPRARIEVGGTSANYVSRLATEEEVVKNMPRLTEMWPALDTYFERTGIRKVFVFEPVDAQT